MVAKVMVDVQVQLCPAYFIQEDRAIYGKPVF